MRVVKEKMEKNEKNAGLNSTFTGVFVSHPESGVLIKATFDEKGIMLWGVVVDENKEMAVRISRNGSEVTFEVKWRGFMVRARKEFGYNLPGILNEHKFTHLYRTPIEYYKAVLSLINMLIEGEYEFAQSTFEAEQKEKEE